MTRDMNIRARLERLDMNVFNNGLIRICLLSDKERYMSKLWFIENIKNNDIKNHMLSDLDVCVSSLETRYNNGIRMNV